MTLIGLVYTTLVTIDNKTISIPNGTLSNSVVTNVTAMDRRRLDLTVGIGYNSDLKQAKEILKQIYTRHPSILKEEEILVYVDSLAEDSVVLGARGWTKSEDYWKTRWDITEQMKLEFDRAGIQIPFKQMDIHISTFPREETAGQEQMHLRAAGFDGMKGTEAQAVRKLCGRNSALDDGEMQEEELPKNGGGIEMDAEETPDGTGQPGLSG